MDEVTTSVDEVTTSEYCQNAIERVGNFIVSLSRLLSLMDIANMLEAQGTSAMMNIKLFNSLGSC